jgi:poly(3-hydroxybutyrate) depolymerase
LALNIHSIVQEEKPLRIVSSLMGLLPIWAAATQACHSDSAANRSRSSLQETRPHVPPSMAFGEKQSEKKHPIPRNRTRIQRVIEGDPSVIVLPDDTRHSGPRPAVLFLHGHGMDEHQMLNRTTLAHRVTEEGWLAAAGLAGSRTHWGNEGALRATAALIKTLIHDYQADPQHIYLVGFSMGGGTALLTAANPLGLPYHIAAVASSQGYSDLRAMYGNPSYASSIRHSFGRSPTAPDLALRSPVSLAEKLRGTALYLEHGESDTAVPVFDRRSRHSPFLSKGLHQPRRRQLVTTVS